MIKERSKRIVVFCIVVIISAVFSGILNPYIVQNSRITELFITVFSILAGVLVAIITIIGDPSFICQENPRLASLCKKEIKKRLEKHAWLFYGYLATLTLIFVSYVVEKAMPCMLRPITAGYSTIGLVSFIYSWRLPSYLNKIQTEKLENIVENKKENHE